AATPAPQSHAANSTVKVAVSFSPASARPGGVIEARVHLKIAPGLMLIAAAPEHPELIGLSVQVLGDHARMNRPRYPAPATLERAYGLGVRAGYRDEVVVSVPLQIASAASSGTLALRVRLHYQACDVKTCYGPESLVVEAPLPILAASLAH
ncbi:MAG: protein-disulfide reductase DsbD N-terminal domain-containing protein, partial [Vicinamibacteria bacterium]|nr:protein-disulfide reductase DsbD N-terminal domain-containing protein [Vicinamibacteria bacterium]